MSKFISCAIFKDLLWIHITEHSGKTHSTFVLWIFCVSRSTLQSGPDAKLGQIDKAIDFYSWVCVNQGPRYFNMPHIFLTISLGKYKIGNTGAATNLWIAPLLIWIYDSIRAYHNNKTTNCWCVHRGLGYQELQLLGYSCILNIEFGAISFYRGKYITLAGVIIQKTYI